MPALLAAALAIVIAGTATSSMAADVGATFPTGESFRFLFADQTVVTDDDAAIYW
jgi:hypothetical protein